MFFLVTFEESRTEAIGHRHAEFVLSASKTNCAIMGIKFYMEVWLKNLPFIMEKISIPIIQRESDLTKEKFHKVAHFCFFKLSTGKKRGIE